ncbi:LPXTG cell wall anchor domain-containing protein [Clostridium sp. AF19-22AC]|jgi:LPXTG-motif cell wall-anchored protein|uniref:LPXTG cell wall anchor domain-containing protein n=1 Tax=Clostridia TaxID=186801 RepID=UPI000E470E06|nr:MULTISPECIES: LPXTG cell wall anchor domain-containing protein [Clostridia]RHR28750.1 LPXTG cell wall anchor domain-containing protein [Clostridium sp. AF19-22AC]
MKTSRMRKLVGVLLSATMLFTMTMGVFAAGSPSADFKSGTKAVDKNGNAVTVTYAAATQTPDEGTIKAVVPNGTLVSAFDLTAPDWDFEKDGALTITFPLPGATSSTKAAILHFGENGWEDVTTSVGDGVITATFTSLSPVAVVVDNSTLTNTGNGTSNGTSPKTGESSLVLTLGLIAMAAAAGVYGLNRKKAYNK